MKQKVYQFNLDGTFVNEFDSQMEASRSVGLGNSTVAEHIRVGSKRPCSGYFFSRDKDFKAPGDFTARAKVSKTTKALGISIDSFRKDHDIDMIVQTALDKLDPNKIYEKKDVVELTGKAVGYPKLSVTIESATEYKGRNGGVCYWSHPDTIEDLKKQGILS